MNRSEGTSPSTRRCSPISLVCHSNHVNVVFVYRPANLGSITLSSSTASTSTTSNYDDNPTNPGRLTSTPGRHGRPDPNNSPGAIKPSTRQNSGKSRDLSPGVHGGMWMWLLRLPGRCDSHPVGVFTRCSPHSLFPAGPRLCLPFSLVGRVNKHITRRGEEARDPPLPWRMQ